MLTYKTLKDKAKEFLAATGLKLDEFANLLPAFEAAYVALYLWLFFSSRRSV